MQAVIGVDIGGTKTKMGLIQKEKEIEVVDTLIFPTSYLRPQKLKNDIIINVEKIIQKNDLQISGIGLASAGRINFNEKEVVYATDNLKDWAEISIVEELENKFNIPVLIDNDVNAALNCELYFNDFQGKTVIFLTIGTGLGGAIS